MKIQDLPGIESWTVTRSTIQGDLMLENTKRVLFDIFSDLVRGGLLPTNDTGSELYSTMIDMLSQGFVLGYDRDKKQPLYSNYPKKMLLEKVPSEVNWQGFDEVDHGDELLRMTIQETELMFNTFSMSTITKSTFRFEDMVYLHQRKIVEDTCWYLLLKRLIQTNLINIDRTPDPGTILMLGSVAASLSRIIAMRFPIEHHGVDMVGKNQQIVMDVSYYVMIRPVSPVDCMYLSGSEVVVPLTAIVPFIMPGCVSFSITDRVTTN